MFMNPDTLNHEHLVRGHTAAMPLMRCCQAPSALLPQPVRGVATPLRGRALAAPLRRFMAVSASVSPKAHNEAAPGARAVLLCHAAWP